MRVNFLASVDFYSPVVNFIEKQSKIRLLVGAVALGIFTGVALYHVFSRVWANRNVQPQEQQVDPAVKKAAGEVLIGDKLPKPEPDPEIQEGKKEEPVENVPPPADVNPDVEQNQLGPNSEKILVLNQNKAVAYLDRNCIMIKHDPNSDPAIQVIKDAFQHFPGNVYVRFCFGMSYWQMVYRDAQTQDLVHLQDVDLNAPVDETYKFEEITNDPTYKEILVLRSLHPNYF